MTEIAKTVLHKVSKLTSNPPPPTIWNTMRYKIDAQGPPNDRTKLVTVRGHE